LPRRCRAKAEDLVLKSPLSSAASMAGHIKKGFWVSTVSITPRASALSERLRN
jgi:hypothetical protein